MKTILSTFVIAGITFVACGGEVGQQGADPSLEALKGTAGAASCAASPNPVAYGTQNVTISLTGSGYPTDAIGQWDIYVGNPLNRFFGFPVANGTVDASGNL